MALVPRARGPFRLALPPQVIEQCGGHFRFLPHRQSRFCVLRDFETIRDPGRILD